MCKIIHLEFSAGTRTHNLVTMGLQLPITKLIKIQLGVWLMGLLCPKIVFTKIEIKIWELWKSFKKSVPWEMFYSKQSKAESKVHSANPNWIPKSFWKNPRVRTFWNPSRMPPPHRILHQTKGIGSNKLIPYFVVLN